MITIRSPLVRNPTRRTLVLVCSSVMMLAPRAATHTFKRLIVFSRALLQ